MFITLYYSYMWWNVIPCIARAFQLVQCSSSCGEDLKELLNKKGIELGTLYSASHLPLLTFKHRTFFNQSERHFIGRINWKRGTDTAIDEAEWGKFSPQNSWLCLSYNLSTLSQNFVQIWLKRRLRIGVSIEPRKHPFNGSDSDGICYGSPS